jgi:hypothetical protein
MDSGFRRNDGWEAEASLLRAFAFKRFTAEPQRAQSFAEFFIKNCHPGEGRDPWAACEEAESPYGFRFLNAP